MTKESTVKAILEIEPQNELALAPDDAKYKTLVEELRLVRLRRDAALAETAVAGSVRYRAEDNDKVSWKFVMADRSTKVFYGDRVPADGSLTKVDDNTVVRCESASDGLVITAGDLSEREVFDPRRVYYTPNGSRVVFKRVEHGKAVLWSYKIQAEVMIGFHCVMERTDAVAHATAATKEKMTQKSLASYIISKNPSITGPELTLQLREAFPEANVTTRHGPHYLSLSRNGRLPEPGDEDPRK